MNTDGPNSFSDENYQNKALIPSNELLIGMYVCELDKPWEDSTFIFQGFLIENDKIRQKVIDECDYVYIDIEKQSPDLPIIHTTIHSAPAKPKTKIKNSFSSKFSRRTLSFLTSTRSKLSGKRKTNRLKDIIDKNVIAETIVQPKKLKTFEQEIKTAQLAHKKTSQMIQDFMEEVKNKGTIDIQIAKSAVRDCMYSVLRTPDALMLTTQLKDKDRNSWHHSMNCCVYSISLARHLNLRDDEMLTLGLCGLLHDIGKTRIPQVILSKKTKLDADENEIMRSHTTLGHNIIMSLPGGLSSVIAEVAHNHHERIDGKGYPRGLAGTQISPYSRIVAIANMYDALTTDSVYENGKTHFEAIDIMLSQSRTHLDETLLKAFIQCIGVFPAGSAVEMNSGEIGIVVEINQQKKLRPKIMLLSDKNKNPQRERIIDLANQESMETESPLSVKTIIRSDAHNLDIEKYFQYGIIQKSIAAAA